jgi:hypothetical protein
LTGLAAQQRIVCLERVGEHPNRRSVRFVDLVLQALGA